MYIYYIAYSIVLLYLMSCLLFRDYGYQISQIANRTTLADGNTWLVLTCVYIRIPIYAYIY